MKKMNISGINLNSNNNTVLVTEKKGALILHSYPDNEEGQKPKYQAQYCTRNKEPYVYIQLSGKGNGNGLPNNEGSQKLQLNIGLNIERVKRNFIKKNYYLSKKI
ncbi:unnamed protein product [Rhizophagus irregularis]|nr:unnamed protein product [Rhizophagus irregularis]